jgi:secreted trypsin-like serine protease
MSLAQIASASVRFPAVLALTLLLAAMPAAQAVVGGLVDHNSASSPFAGVGSLTRDGKEVYSAVLIAPQYALTAAHVVNGTLFAGSLNFNLNMGGNLTFSVPVAEIFVNPAYRGYKPGPDGTVHGDLAVVRLASPVPEGTPIYPLHDEMVAPGQEIVFVGYGGGLDMSGVRVPPAASVKRKGSSEIEALLPGSPGSEPGDVFVFRSWPGMSVTGWRAGLASGDSGSPAFVRGPDGRLELVGINTFAFGAGAGQPGSFVAGGGGIVLAQHSEWIQSVLNEVPEPASAKLIGIGVAVAIAMAGLAARRRRRSAQ